MPLPCVANHTAAQCSAMSKHTKQRCLNLAAYGCKTCRFHGARKPASIKKGKNCNFYIHGNDSRAARKARPAKLKKAKEEIKQLEELLKQDVILELPFNDPEAKALNAEMDQIIKTVVTGVAKVIAKKHKANKKPTIHINPRR